MQNLTPVKLFYKSYGTGQPLVILHGLFGSSDNWQGLSQRAFARHFRVLVPDLRNHGRSPHSDIFNYSAMVQDLAHFFAERGLSTANLMGHSLGGKTAMLFALTFPERVKTLVVVDIAPKEYPPKHLEIFEALRDLDLEAYESKTEIDEALRSRIPSALVRQFLLKSITRQDDRYRWRINLKALYRNYEELNSALALGRVFEGPTLFIKGANSDYVTDEDFPRILRLFPNAEMATVESAGHWVHFDQPEAFANLVLEKLT